MVEVARSNDSQVQAYGIQEWTLKFPGMVAMLEEVDFSADRA
jgi:hypothetical protein